MADGIKGIEEIEVGEMVWAQSDRTGEVELKRVKQLFVNVAASLVVITAGTNTIEATDEHPFWVVEQELLRKAQSYYSSVKININGAPATSAVHSRGYPRNADWFWTKIEERHSEMLSPENLERIRRRLKGCPKVDDQWLKCNPQHAQYKDQQLIHHHIDQGSHATALPVGVKREYHAVLHPDRSQ